MRKPAAGPDRLDDERYPALGVVFLGLGGLLCWATYNWAVDAFQP